MSLFNMMLSGGGGEGFKTATPNYQAYSMLQFQVENEPQEYILMLTVSSASTPIKTTSTEIAFIANLPNLDIGCTYGGASAARFTVDTSATYVTASYYSGAFSVTQANSTYRFDTDDTYILYYR